MAGDITQEEKKTLIRLTVGRKIALGFIIGTIITLVVGIMGVYGVITLTKAMNFITLHQIPLLYGIEKLNYQRILHRSLLYEIQITENQENRIARIQAIRDTRQNLLSDIDAEWANMQQIPRATPVDSQAYQELEDRYTTWRGDIQVLIGQKIDRLIQDTDHQKLSELYQEYAGLENQARTYSDKYEVALMSLFKINNQYIGQTISNNAVLSKRITLLMAVFMVLGVLIAIALGFIVTRLITQPVKQVLVLLKAMSQGDLNQHIETLSNDEIGEMVYLLQHEIRAKLEAEAANQAKSNFLATMSHEIRTPLNAILGLTEIELQKNLPPDSHLELEKIQTAGSSLLGIINDILDISKIEAGSFELIPVEYDLPSLINDTVQLNILRIGSKPVKFILEIDETIPSVLYGDELRVKQILNNLLSNAFKYTKAGKVVLRVQYERQESLIWMIFIVIDSGIGIKHEEISKLFDKYLQLDLTVNRTIEGTGLGLSITKRILELMEGTIKVESEYGKGSRFTVRVPQKMVRDTPIGKVVADNLRSLQFIDFRRQGKNLIRDFMPYGKVLVVDDVITNLDVAQGLLKPYGLYVECVSSGKEAIDRIQKQEVQYDLVLMDHMMPSMDGMTAVRIIRQEIDSDYAKTVPIVALTANALAGNEAMFLANGFNGFISKPIDVMRLDMILKRWLRDKQSEETLRQAAQEKLEKIESSFRDGAPSLLKDYIVPGLDFAEGIARYEQEEIYLRILKTYLNHGKEMLGQIEQVSAETLSKYVITIHGLKGASYGVGAKAVGKAAQELETAAKAGDIETVQDKNPAFLVLLQTLLEDIKTLLEKTDAAERRDKKHAASPAPEMLEKLLEACIHFKTAVIEDILTDLEGYDYETGGKLIHWLREQIDNIEYDAMQENLTALKQKGWQVDNNWEPAL